jgi:S1-C subfamily serine protease
MKKFKQIAVALVAILMIVTTIAGCAGPAGAEGVSVSSAAVNDSGSLILTLSNGQTIDAGYVMGTAGAARVSITSASVDGSGHLILTLSNGQTIDAGYVMGPQGPKGDSAAAGGSFAAVVTRVEPCIVRVDVTVSGGLDSGSGTIVSNQGYIITNEHVVSGAQSIQVTLMDGTVLSATIVTSDANKDMAIIKLDSSRTDFPVMELAPHLIF